jgi:hypothetical protein
LDGLGAVNHGELYRRFTKGQKKEIVKKGSRNQLFAGAIVAGD